MSTLQMVQDRNLPFAEDVAYWKTGRTAPDRKIDQVVAMIDSAGGCVHERGFMQKGQQSAFLVEFSLDGNLFRIVWPVLATKSGETDMYPARIQAATHIYHHVKATLQAAQILGARMAFAPHLVLEDERTIAHHLATPAVDLGRLLFDKATG